MKFSLLSPLSCYCHLFSLSFSSFSSFSIRTKPEHHKHKNKRDQRVYQKKRKKKKGQRMWVLCNPKEKKKKKKPWNKSKFLFDSFSYRAETTPRSKLVGWRKSVFEETKKELKISILSGEAKKILLCKVGVRLPSLPL